MSMIKHAVAAVFVVIVLSALIAYSKLQTAALHVSGFVEADEIRLGSRVGGRVQAVHVAEGDHIVAGQLLVQLEPFDLNEQRRGAQATLAAKEAECQRLSHGLRPEEVAQTNMRMQQVKAQLDKLIAGPRPNEIQAATARLKSAHAELRLAQERYTRTRELRGSGAVSTEDMDRAQQALDSATANTALYREELALLNAGSRDEDIREARAQLEFARLEAQLANKGYRKELIAEACAARDGAAAALAAIDRQIEELFIKAPAAGVIEALELQPGDLVLPGVPMLSMLDNQRYWIRAYIPQHWKAVTLGQTVWITADSHPDKVFEAKIGYIARQAEFTPSNAQTHDERGRQVFRIKAILQQGLDELRPGVAVDLWLNREDLS